MFDLLKDFLRSRAYLASMQSTAIHASLDDRNAAIEAAQRKRDKKRKAKKKAKKGARELTETIAGFAPLFGVAGAVIGHVLGKQEGAAIGERIGRHAQAKLEDATKDAAQRQEAKEERWRLDEKERLERCAEEAQKDAAGLQFLISANLENGNMSTVEVLKLCRNVGSFAEIQAALHAVADVHELGGPGQPTIWKLKGIPKNG